LRKEIETSDYLLEIIIISKDFDSSIDQNDESFSVRLLDITVEDENGDLPLAGSFLLDSEGISVIRSFSQLWTIDDSQNIEMLGNYYILARHSHSSLAFELGATV
jgi:hypothetical protein